MKKTTLFFVFLMMLIGADFAPAEDRPVSMAVAGEDGVAVVVHPLNPVRMLTGPQLREIFTRKTRGWHRMGGSHELSIRPLVGESSSPSREIFRQRILAGRDFQECEFLEGDDQVLHAVAGDEAAIGLVSLSAAKGRKGVRIIAVDGQKADLNNPSYPLLFP